MKYIAIVDDLGLDIVAPPSARLTLELRARLNTQRNPEIYEIVTSHTGATEDPFIKSLMYKSRAQVEEMITKKPAEYTDLDI